MSQEEILKIITENPGIKQSEIIEKSGVERKGNCGDGKISKELRQLAKKKEIIRVSCSGIHGTTFKLYPYHKEKKT